MAPWYLLVGTVVGVLARLIYPCKENMDWLMTILISALSAFIGGGIGIFTGWYTFWWIGFVVSVAAAVIIVTIYAAIKGKK